MKICGFSVQVDFLVGAESRSVMQCITAVDFLSELEVQGSDLHRAYELY